MVADPRGTLKVMAARRECLAAELGMQTQMANEQPLGHGDTR